MKGGRPAKQDDPSGVEAGSSAPDVPGPQALAYMLPAMWERHDLLDVEATLLGRSDPAAAATKRLGQDLLYARIDATKRLALALEPVTAADAVAQIFLTHAEIHDAMDNDDLKEIPVLLESAMRALAVIARTAAFDLEAMARDYMSAAETMIVRGEVDA